MCRLPRHAFFFIRTIHRYNLFELCSIKNLGMEKEEEKITYIAAHTRIEKTDARQKFVHMSNQNATA